MNSLSDYPRIRRAIAAALRDASGLFSGEWADLVLARVRLEGAALVVEQSIGDVSVRLTLGGRLELLAQDSIDIRVSTLIISARGRLIKQAAKSDMDDFVRDLFAAQAREDSGRH